MLKNLLSKLWHYFSYVLVIYGYYLVFLFFYDTFLRVAKPFAFILALLITGLFFSITLLFWFKDKIIERFKK